MGHDRLSCLSGRFSLAEMASNLGGRGPKDGEGGAMSLVRMRDQAVITGVILASKAAVSGKRVY